MTTTKMDLKMKCYFCNKGLAEVPHIIILGERICKDCRDFTLKNLKTQILLEKQTFKCVGCEKIFPYKQIINLPHTPRYKVKEHVSVCHQCIVDSVCESFVSVDIISANTQQLRKHEKLMNSNSNSNSTTTTIKPPLMNQIPLCDIPLTKSQLDYHIGSSTSDMIEGLVLKVAKKLICADCWAITIEKSNKTTVKMNSYELYEKVGRCWNTEHPNYIYNEQYEVEKIWRKSVIKKPSKLTDELKIGDQLHIYMFGENSWKIVITKKMASYDVRAYASKKFMENGNY